MEEKHVWEIIEIELKAQNTYENAYMEVDVWADLTGPEFNKRVYGFWDGGNTFKIRMTAVGAGRWSYVTGCNTGDAGLTGKEGVFEAVLWSEEEKEQNACRRGMVTATSNGHALQYSDGTPVYLLGDTEWALFTNRFPWFDSDEPRPIGPEMGFKDVIRHRKAQGFNLVATISCLPAWRDDGFPSTITMEDGCTIRSGWRNPKKTGYNGVKDMKNEGGYAFEFPGRVPGYENVFPDMERPNPEYFKYLDRKMNWLNENGITVFIETLRRDISTTMKKYYSWPDAYVRYIQFMFSRYQANNCIFSPIHFDSPNVSIPTSDYNLAANTAVEKHGMPPFGTLVSCNSSQSSFIDFGHTGEAKWLSMHQTGNNAREHDTFWYLTQIYEQTPPVPALNGEPYYPGSMFGCGRDQIIVNGFCEEANIRTRSCIYGDLLSGGLAGYIYGAEGMWNANNELEAVYKIWDSLEYPSSYQVKHVNAFLGIIGSRYVDLVPTVEHVTPNKAGDDRGHKGWAYCASLPDKSELLLYFEVDCPQCELRGLKQGSRYEVHWFDPREGIWFKDESVEFIETSISRRCMLPARPDRRDYGMYLKRI